MHPRMCEGSVIQGDCWKICILTDTLIRFEWSDTDVFVDDFRAMVINRQFGPIPNYTVTCNNDSSLEIETLELRNATMASPSAMRGCTSI